ncbi:hypothetical protein KP803_14635 [Vibrio sp. ZSDE26]|uniref:Uncharacterized protein n=1 Tax=Vibrio amylolyticus TaxID=2847292 RepID=A0A9X2BI17_9VIBR|nr:hypothetical protein [Vibrio amylolyticus]MCK6264514.1 hypothetical protein [Vibrio amylolyticus]
MLKRISHLFAMLTLLLCSNIVMAGAYTQINSIDAALSTNQISLNETSVNQYDVTQSIDERTEKSTPETDGFEDDGFTLFDNEIPHFLSSTRRIVSDDNCVGHNVEPEYFLLVAFSPPPLLELAKSSIVIPNVAFHWTSQVSSSSRLSGWKESNLIYSQRHSKHS